MFLEPKKSDSTGEVEELLVIPVASAPPAKSNGQVKPQLNADSQCVSLLQDISDRATCLGQTLEEQLELVNKQLGELMVIGSTVERTVRWQEVLLQTALTEHDKKRLADEALAEEQRRAEVQTKSLTGGCTGCSS